MAYSLDSILSLVPQGDSIDWSLFEKTELAGIFASMNKTPQSKLYHGEGNVLIHTRLACEALIRQNEYKLLSENNKAILFLACLLHDIGKTKCTTLKDGDYTSPKHSIVGTNMARELLWRDFGLCGSYEKQQMREGVCQLIRYHSFPPFAISDKNPEKRLLKIASNGELARSFTIEGLCLLERADVLGRISKDRNDYLERIELCAELAKEIGCFYGPYKFNDDYSKRAYFSNKTDWRDCELYNSSWGKVIILSGLPGTGKDTFIKENYPNLPVISLDEIRAELHILPTENQGAVVARAHELAREYLRKKQEFIWNATSISPLIRNSQISLFEEYGAGVEIVFLETEFEENLARNASRVSAVPRSVIENMLSRLEPPERFEAEKIKWLTI